MPVTQPSKEPTQLQVNNSGAWKTVVHFDAADQRQVKAVETAAELLSMVAPKTTFRLMGNGHLAALMWIKNGVWSKG
jgi:hypothetical protein